METITITKGQLENIIANAITSAGIVSKTNVEPKVVKERKPFGKPKMSAEIVAERCQIAYDKGYIVNDKDDVIGISGFKISSKSNKKLAITWISETGKQLTIYQSDYVAFWYKRQAELKANKPAKQAELSKPEKADMIVDNTTIIFKAFLAHHRLEKSFEDYINQYDVSKTADKSDETKGIEIGVFEEVKNEPKESETTDDEITISDYAKEKGENFTSKQIMEIEDTLIGMNTSYKPKGLKGKFKFKRKFLQEKWDNIIFLLT